MRLGRRLDTGIAEDPVPAPEPAEPAAATTREAGESHETREPRRAPAVAEV